MLQQERELVATATTQQQGILYATTVSLLVRCSRADDDAIEICRKGLDFMEKQKWQDNQRLQKRWKAHFLFQMCRHQVSACASCDDDNVESTLDSLDSLSSSLSYEEKTVLAMTHAIRDMKRQHPDAADKWLTETATELGNAFKKNKSGDKLSLESLRAHYYLIYALNAHLSGRAGQLASEGSYPAFEELFKSMERIGDKTLQLNDLQPPLDNTCANILGEMLHANLLRVSGHGGDAAVQIEESLEHAEEKLGKEKPVIQLHLVNLEYRCLAALVVCDFQASAKFLSRAGALIEQYPDLLRDHVESVSLLLGQYFHSTREYDAALEVFNGVHTTMATLCAALTELHVEKHHATSASARMNTLKELHLNSLPTHERSIVQMINGLILCRQNDSTGARLLFTKSLKQAHGMIGSGQFVGQILNCLAPVQQERQDLAGALQMFESSATLLKSVKDLISLVTTLKGMEKLYIEMKDNDKASSCRQYLERKSNDLTGRLQRVYDNAHHKECIALANRLKSM